MSKFITFTDVETKDEFCVPIERISQLREKHTTFNLGYYIFLRDTITKDDIHEISEEEFNKLTDFLRTL